MASQSSRRSRRASTADLETEERRGWLSHGIAALAISALGLAVAGSVSLTTSAQTTAESRPQTTLATGGQTSGGPQLPGQTQPGQTQPGQTLPGQTLPGQVVPGKAGIGPAVAAAPELEAFTRSPAEADEESRSSVREAIVEERAAQRSEDLTESAEEISRAAVEQGKSARLQELAKADRARREAAVKIAQERTRKAIQARVAAEVQRELAAAKAANSTDTTGADQTTTPSTTPEPQAQADTTAIPSGGGARSPVPGAIVGASFGATGAWARYHTGLDFRAGFGTPIRAVTAGVVVYSGNKGNWAGNHVAVRHAGGYTSMSSHMQSMAVRAGQSVQAGQVIGYVGSTGRSFGAHLHFEIYPPGVQPGNVYSAINPIPWLRARGVSTN